MTKILNLLDLPNEILEKIIVGLDKKNTLGINKRFYNLTKNKTFKIIVIDLAKEINLDNLKNFNQTKLKIICTKIITPEKVCLQLAKLEQLKKLNTIFIEVNFPEDNSRFRVFYLDKFIVLKTFSYLIHPKNKERLNIKNFYLDMSEKKYYNWKGVVCISKFSRDWSQNDAGWFWPCISTDGIIKLPTRQDLDNFLYPILYNNLKFIERFIFKGENNNYFIHDTKEKILDTFVVDKNNVYLNNYLIDNLSDEIEEIYIHENKSCLKYINFEKFNKLNKLSKVWYSQIRTKSLLSINFLPDISHFKVNTPIEIEWYMCIPLKNIDPYFSSTIKKFYNVDTLNKLFF